MELELRDGDYVADGVGGLRRVEGREALLQRVLFRLTARRGAFPFWENLGSQLWRLGRIPAAERSAAARQYVTEALAEEPVSVESVSLRQSPEGRAELTAELRYQGEPLPVTVGILPSDAHTYNQEF